jgi:hypothetical protein
MGAVLPSDALRTDTGCQTGAASVVTRPGVINDCRFTVARRITAVRTLPALIRARVITRRV